MSTVNSQFSHFLKCSLSHQLPRLGRRHHCSPRGLEFPFVPLSLTSNLSVSPVGSPQTVSRIGHFSMLPSLLSSPSIVSRLDLWQSPISALSLPPILFSAWALLLKHKSDHISLLFTALPWLPVSQSQSPQGPHVPGHPRLSSLRSSHHRLLSCMSWNPKSCPHWDLCLRCVLSLQCAPRRLYGWLPPFTQISNQRPSRIILHKIFQTLPLPLSPGFCPLVMG